MFSKYNFGVIRNLRRRLNMTMEQLAQKSGLTYPTVASIETQKTLPSLKTLDAIAGILQISTSDLLALAERKLVQMRKAHPQVRQIPAPPGLDKCKVAKFDKGKLIRVNARAGELIHVMELHEDCHEMCYVLKGKVILQIEDHSYDLSVDDTILFDGVLDHQYKVLEDAEFITVHIPKNVQIIEALLHNIDPSNNLQPLQEEHSEGGFTTS